MKILISTFFLVWSLTSMAQLKVDQNGRIGMGFNFPNPGYKCHIKGNLLLSDYPASNFNEFVFRVGNGWPGTEFGSNKDVLAVWYTSWTGYNRLHAESFHKPSDIKLKRNISPISNGLERVMGLKTYIYEIEKNSFSEDKKEIKGYKKEYGFISQEIEKYLTEVDIVEEGKDELKLMEYDQIIPLAISAIQEQQVLIESLQEEIQELKSNIKEENIDFTDSKAVLLQNKPNPFKSNTIIEYDIKESIENASISVFNLNGNLVKTYPITERNKGSVIINANELNPGIYIYTLIVNNEEIDSKRMILLD